MIIHAIMFGLALVNGSIQLLMGNFGAGIGLIGCALYLTVCRYPE